MPCRASAHDLDNTKRLNCLARHSMRRTDPGLPQMGQPRTISFDAHRPIHSRPPIAYFLISASYLRKSSRFAGGTAAPPAADL
jgi:hypothetical protein